MASDNATRVPERAGIDSRVVVICGVSILLALLTGFIAQALVGLIGLITNVAFYGRFSTAFVSPAGNTLGSLVIIVPVIGGIVYTALGAVVGWLAVYRCTGAQVHRRVDLL